MYSLHHRSIWPSSKCTTFLVVRALHFWPVGPNVDSIVNVRIPRDVPIISHRFRSTSDATVICLAFGDWNAPFHILDCPGLYWPTLDVAAQFDDRRPYSRHATGTAFHRHDIDSYAWNSQPATVDCMFLLIRVKFGASKKRIESAAPYRRKHWFPDTVTVVMQANPPRWCDSSSLDRTSNT